MTRRPIPDLERLMRVANEALYAVAREARRVESPCATRLRTMALESDAMLDGMVPPITRDMVEARKVAAE